MTNAWTQRARRNLLPLSVEQDNLKKALAEWFYTGRTFDLEAPDEDCELCEHPNIRFQFEIQNMLTENRLLIGSECILRFSIHAVDADGDALDAAATTKKVRRDRRKLITDARAKRVIKCLLELAASDSEFTDLDQSIAYFQDRGVFSPNHLAFLLWRLDENGIRYSKPDFKLTIRRDREKDQLRKMPEWKRQKLWPAMSASQKRWCEENVLAETS